MTKLIKRITAPVLSLIFLLNMSSAGMAETTVSAEVGFIFNTLLFLICGFLVMFMAAGFAMLESGMVTSKSVSVICAKNIGLYAIAGIMFWLVGYNLAYGIPEGGYIGSFTPWSDASAVDTGYADGSDWFFQMVFCATTVSGEVQAIFNSLLFLICGFLVMFMAAGFAMLESGMVTSKSVSVICAKNIGLYSIAGIMFWLFGYNLAYGIPEGGYIGTFTPWSDASAVDTGYADGSDWFFQMVFCATTVSICSGAMAERIKLWPFFLFAAILAGVIYPIVMGWQWGGGWLAELGFSDFAGSTLVHSTGGAAALAGIM